MEFSKAALPQILFNKLHDVDAHLFIDVLDNGVDILLLHHAVVADKPLHRLDIALIPLYTVLLIRYVVVQHGLEPTLILMPDRNLVVLIEHNAEIPVSTCRRTIPCFGRIDGERGREARQSVNHCFFHSVNVKIKLR